MFTVAVGCEASGKRSTLSPLLSVYSEIPSTVGPGVTVTLAGRAGARRGAAGRWAARGRPVATRRSAIRPVRRRIREFRLKGTLNLTRPAEVARWRGTPALPKLEHPPGSNR